MTLPSPRPTVLEIVIARGDRPHVGSVDGAVASHGGPDSRGDSRLHVVLRRYVVRFDDLAHRERAWAAFGADPEWHRVRAESERDGPIVARIRNEIRRLAPYSPMQ